MAEPVIACDEILYRRIPPSTPWFEPPDRVTTANFKLHKSEGGLSVYRAVVVSASDVLAKAEAKPGSGIAEATARQIRTAQDNSGTCLQLDILPINDEKDPGHAEIRGAILKDRPKPAAKVLRDLFKLTHRPVAES